MAAFVPKVTFARARTILAENRHFSAEKIGLLPGDASILEGAIGVHSSATAHAKLEITLRFTPKRSLGA